MNIETIIVGEFQVNCYVVWGETTDALIIDPGGDHEIISACLKEYNLTAAAYLLTHAHIDHINALKPLYDKMPAPIAIHSKDLEWAFTEDNQMPPFYPNSPERPDKIERILEDKQEWIDAGLKYRVVAVPGHTLGSICFYFPDEETLFTGDMLFAGSIGRTDLQGGDPYKMRDSIKIMAEFPDSTVIYPGHGPTSNMDIEKRTNPFFKVIK